MVIYQHLTDNIHGLLFYSKVLEGNQPTTAFSDRFNQNKNQQVYFNLSIPVFNKLQVKSNVEIAKLNKINADLEKEKQLIISLQR